jgi:opine dehydrogenase
VAEPLAANMRADQMLVMFPGYFMAESMATVFLDLGKDGIPICELTSAPVVSDMAPDGKILIHKRKNSLKFATHNGYKKDAAFAFMKKYLPMLSLASNTIETSLDNINSILHPLPVLLNLVSVDRDAGSFRHFFDGVDKNVSILMHLMDEERCAVSRAFGLRPEPVLDQLKSYYGNNDATTIYEFFQSPECPYKEIRGFGLDSRYITLDVPNLIARTCSLARSKNVPTPIFDSCLTLAGPFLNLK